MGCVGEVKECLCTAQVQGNSWDDGGIVFVVLARDSVETASLVFLSPSTSGAVALPAKGTFMLVAPDAFHHGGKPVQGDSNLVQKTWKRI
uniref:Uncharacterized protein n=1 Tax=Tanacetum cinerariifolium TaxID=118510 RepID=A0A6L2NRU7_TANCI|nr:hypothetical protein [Tanacetum cinerariifolium]